MNFYVFKSLGYIRKLKFALSEKITAFLDSVQFLFRRDRSFRHKPGLKKSVLIIGKEFNFRVSKYAKLLASSNKFEIILACHKYSPLNAELSSGNFKVIRFRNEVHLKNMLQNSNMDLAIAFTSVVKYACIVMKYFPGKKIFDPYDCLIIYYGMNPHIRWMKNEVVREKYCLSHCDGVLARNLEVKYAAKLSGVQFTHNNILFSDYCDADNFIQPVVKNPGGDPFRDGIHIVYSGGLYGPSAQAAAHGITNFRPLVLSLSQTKINLHLYPVPNSPLEYYVEFIAEAKLNPHLHMYESIPHKNLGKELSQYHFGILPHFREPGHPILKEKLSYGTSNKFFNYLEAGLPVIVSEELSYMAWITKRYKIGIVISRNDLVQLDKIIASVNYRELVSNVVEVRKKLTLTNNIERLVRFIEKT